jgi:outer membrane protein assembly factor BamC
VLTGSNKDSSTWQARAAEPELEAEMLRRLLLKLGAKEEQATALVAPGEAAPARARLLSGGPAGTVEVDDDFDRAWRRVGLALDRSGFAVEDRDRAQGFYYVSYTDQSQAPTKQEPGVFSKLLNFGGLGSDKKDAKQVVRYRVQVKSEGKRSKVTVQNSEGGAPDNDVATRLAQVLVNDLK